MTKRIAVKDLHADSIDAVSITVDDWQRIFSNFEEEDGNHFWEAQRCEKCGEIVTLGNGSGGGDQHTDVNFETECDGYIPTSEGPMMNYWYPVDQHDFDPEIAAAKLVDLPLCVVEISGQFGLALTGGGMDLSWEICEAFTLLGELPPAKWCDLPRMAGRGTSARDKYIMSVCRATMRVRILRAKNTLQSLRRLGEK